MASSAAPRPPSSRWSTSRAASTGTRSISSRYDDGYSPPKTVEQVRRLVEDDQVDFCFQNLGTPCNSAIAEYLNHKQIPHLFVGSGAASGPT